MKITAIIPARAGSKRLKNKNIYPVNNKPMILYTIDACKKSKYNIDIWVSTDSYLIKLLCKDHGANIHDRDPGLSDDKTFKQEVIRSTASYLKKQNRLGDIVLSLQANSPTMTSNEIDLCIDTLIKYNRDEIISVDKNLMQDASIRVLRGDYVFQKDLSTNCGVVITDLFDIHTIDDVRHVEKIMQK